MRRLLFSAALALVPLAAVAAQLEMPLHLPYETIGLALGARLGSTAQPGEVYRDGRCRYLTYQTPKLAPLEGRLVLEGPGAAAIGVELAGKCQIAAAWRGTIRFTLLPQIDNAGRVRLR